MRPARYFSIIQLSNSRDDPRRERSFGRTGGQKRRNLTFYCRKRGILCIIKEKGVRTMRKFIGVDLGGTNIRAAIVSEDGTILNMKKSESHPEEACFPIPVVMISSPPCRKSVVAISSAT